MKIGILTHYSVNNQGAVLQTYAMYKYLERIGHQPCVLAYRKNFDFADKSTFQRYHIGVSSIPYFLNDYLFRRGPGITLYNVQKNSVLARFRKRQFRFEPYARSQCDAVIVGSDEVFSIPVGINPMMFGHGVPAGRLIAYAPSFGQTTVQDLDRFRCFGLAASGLRQFDALSARDTHTQQMIETLCGRSVPIICDPVLLYDFSHQSCARFSGSRKPYLMVYSYDRNMNAPEESGEIRSFAQSRGLTVVSAGTYHKWCDHNRVCDPIEWLEYFRHARFCVTDTFHGLIAAALCGCPMAVRIRGINENKLSCLVTQLGLEKRVLNGENGDLHSVLDTPVDFSAVREKIACLREAGGRFLCESLGIPYGNGILPKADTKEERP